MTFSETCLLYAAGELSPSEVSAFERHLGGCGECRGLLETSRLASELSPALSEDAPERLVAAVLKRGPAVPEESRREASIFGWLTLGPFPAAGAVALASLTLSLFWLGSIEERLHWEDGSDSAIEELSADLEDFDEEDQGLVWDDLDFESEMDEFEEESDDLEEILAGGVL